MKIMPEPRRKRYYRIHLAYLIVILTLKQSLSITMIRDLLPSDQPEEEMEAFYRMYTARHRIVSEYFVQQVRAAAGSILDHEQPSQTAVENASDLIIASAMVGGLTRLLAEKLLLLEGQNTSEAAPAAEPAPDCCPIPTRTGLRTPSGITPTSIPRATCSLSRMRAVRGLPPPPPCGMRTARAIFTWWGHSLPAAARASDTPCWRTRWRNCRRGRARLSR